MTIKVLLQFQFLALFLLKSFQNLSFILWHRFRKRAKQYVFNKHFNSKKKVNQPQKLTMERPNEIEVFEIRNVLRKTKFQLFKFSSNK